MMYNHRQKVRKEKGSMLSENSKQAVALSTNVATNQSDNIRGTRKIVKRREKCKVIAVHLIIVLILKDFY